MQPKSKTAIVASTGCEIPCQYNQYKSTPASTSTATEFGGALGLFLGFSNMTIYDGVEGLPRIDLSAFEKLMSQNKNRKDLGTKCTTF